MKRYIKTNTNNEIIELFFEYETTKFDGTEILMDDIPQKCKLIGDKYISNEYGIYVFTWDGNNAIEKTQEEIDNNPDFITEYKKEKRDQLFEYIDKNMYDINKTLDQIRAQWTSFKTNSSSWVTKQDVDDAYDQAMTWLHS